MFREPCSGHPGQGFFLTAQAHRLWLRAVMGDSGDRRSDAPAPSRRLWPESLRDRFLALFAMQA